MSQGKKSVSGLRRLSLLGLALFVIVVGALALRLYTRVGMWRTEQAVEPVHEPVAVLPLSSAELSSAVSNLPTAQPPFLDEASLEPPTTTPAPVPTWTPTPVITPIPLAKPPYVLLSDKTQPQSNKLIFGRNNAIWSISESGKDEQMLVDIVAKTSSFLPGNNIVTGDFSPKEQIVAFVLISTAIADEGKNTVPSEYSIYLFDMKTDDLKLLVSDGYNPIWSPDGTKIAYIVATTGDLKVIDVVSHETYLVYHVDAQNEHYVTDIDWSPDSSHLVFIDEVFRQSTSMLVVDTRDNRTTQQIGPDSIYTARYPQWAPTGDLIAYLSIASEEAATYHSEYSLWTVRPDGSAPKQITHDMDIVGGPHQWSPDARWLAFAAAPPFEEAAPMELWVIGRTGEDLKRLTSVTIQVM